MTNAAKLLYTLKIKLKDQLVVNMEIHDGESINEIVRGTVQTHKLSNELQEALLIYVQRKLEGIVPSQNESN